MFSLNELEVFLAAANARSFSAAARQIHISQPAVSLQIRSLERRLRTTLFLREGRSVSLTEAGQVLAPLARDILTRARRAEEAVAAVQGEVAGELSLACSTTSGKYLLPHLIAAFRERFPKVAARILVTDHISALRLLRDGFSNLAVTSTAVDHPDLEYRPLFSDRIVLIVPREHPWRDLGRISPSQLLDERMLIREESAGTRKALDQGLSRFGLRVEDLNIAMELGNAEAIEMSVEAGLGVAFVSIMAAAKGIELGRVSVVEVDGMELTRPIMMARSRQHPATRAQTAFCHFAQEGTSQQLLQKMVFPAGWTDPNLIEATV